MPLSEHEQKLLEQLEKQLHEDDPKFASSMGSVPGRSWSTRHLVIGVLATLAGVLLLLVGVSMQNIFVGVLGFVVMGAGVYFATMRSSAVGKARILNQASGFVKIVAEKKYDEVLGVHIIGPRATELVAEAVLALRLECTVEELVKTIHAHPTMAEAIGEAAHAVNGAAIQL